MARHRATTVRICGPADNGCWVYGTRRDDEHLWGRANTEIRHEHGEGRLCDECGLPMGTWQTEVAYDAHAARTGHGLGAGVCEDECGADYDWLPDFLAGREAERRDRHGEAEAQDHAG